MEHLLSVDEAAKTLRLSHWTIRKWIRSGKLPGAKVGRRRVVRERDLLRLIVEDPKPAGGKP